ncbi:MAG: transposase [Hadesarchaea archaeon]|nr:transposase [Hadesarchaea archaeon]
MQVVKTVKIPVHYATTKRKLDILNRLTARLTYGVRIWSQIIETNSIHTRSGLRRREFEQEVQKQTGLSAGFVQCCADTALWMWKSYWKLHREWERRVKRAQRRGDERWLHKLLKREPQPPFSNGSRHKIPIWFDYRIGSLEKSESIKISPRIIRISTLKYGGRITVLLNPARYHLDLLERGEIKSFQIVKRGKKFYVHVKVEYEAQDQSVRAVRGIDFGIRRSAATVSLHPNRPLRRGDFSVIRDGEKVQRLNELNRRVAELQQLRKWEALKRIRSKRRRVAEYYDRLTAKRIAEISNGCVVAIGYPKKIKYENYRGNGKRKLRRLMTRWAYDRIIRYTIEECAEQGVAAVARDERWSSMTCHRCGSRDTERPTQSVFHCNECGLTYNADFNGAINIGSSILAEPRSRLAEVDPALTSDELAGKASEAGSPCF